MKKNELKTLIKETIEEMAKSKSTKIKNSKLYKLIDDGMLMIKHKSSDRVYTVNELVKDEPDDEEFSGWNFYVDESSYSFPWEECDIFMLTPVTL